MSFATTRSSTSGARASRSARRTARSPACCAAACCDELAAGARRGRPGRLRHAPAADRRPGQDRLHRAELPLARRRGRHRARPSSRRSSASSRTRSRRRARRCALPEGTREGGLRGRDRGGHRRALHARRRRTTRSTTSPATCSSTTSPPATGSSRRRSGCPGKVFDGSAPCGPALVTPDEAGPARRDRVQARAERRGDAGGLDRRPDPLGAGAVAHLSELMTLEPGRHDLHGDAVRRRQRARPAACGSRRGTRS